MIDAHKVVDYLKDHFHQSDIEIVVLLAQGTLMMKEIHSQMMKKGLVDIPGFDENLIEKLEEMDAYLSDVIDEEAPL